MTRRDLILAAARIGGAGLATGVLETIGLTAESDLTDLETLDPIGSNAPEVLILGAGIAGMCAAYELESLGYRCRVLEARPRSGGRCVTLRAGDRSEEQGETQTCTFDRNHYFNPGPTRIPPWHVTVDYCRKFGIPLAPWINVNENAFILQTRGPLANSKLRIRDVIADTEGYLTLSMRGAVDDRRIGAAWSARDRKAVMRYLSAYGRIDNDGVYRGTRCRSFKDFDPVSSIKPTHGAPIDMRALFSGGIGGYFKFINSINQQMTMLEVVGGTDRIATAFQRSLRARIEFGCEVTEIDAGPAETIVTFKDRSGKAHTARAPYCICTVPLTVLRGITTNFSNDALDAVRQAVYVSSTKVGVEFEGRFWEDDERIYGGVSWTDQQIHQIMYPSWGFHSACGVLTTYNSGASARKFDALAPTRRVSAALAELATIHPQAPAHFKSAVTVSWDRVPYSQGAYVAWNLTPDAGRLYRSMLEPQASLYFAGEHCSQLTAWMAGAIESARSVTKKIHLRASSKASF